MTKEYLDVLDEQGNIIGKAAQEEIYAQKLNHRIVHIFILHPDTEEVYLQKRSMEKSFLPGYYCTSAGGHVRSGESYLEGAQRELKEELGISTPLVETHSFLFESDGHKRFITIFTTQASGKFTFTDGEVESGSFHNFDEAHTLIEKNELIHPQLLVCFRWMYKHKKEVLQMLSTQ